MRWLYWWYRSSSVAVLTYDEVLFELAKSGYQVHVGRNMRLQKLLNVGTFLFLKLFLEFDSIYNTLVVVYVRLSLFLKWRVLGK